MPKYWFDHVHALNADPLKMADFFEKMFGAERIEVETPPGLGSIITLKIGEFKIKFMSPRAQPFGVTYGLEHIAMRTDDIETAVKELKQEGAKLERGIIQENTGGIKFKSAFISIDNNFIELQEVVK